MVNRIRCIALAVAVVVGMFASADAFAEACSITSGYTKWSAVGTTSGTAWSGSPCTPTGDDTFTVNGGELEITAPIAMTSGSFTCTSGTLRINPGAGLDYSAAGSGSPVITFGGCTVYIEGEKVWEGRVGPTAITYAAGPPATAAFTVTGGGSPTAVGSTTTDYLVFGDDDPASATASIRKPLQIGSGMPDPNKHRPSYVKWSWYDVTGLSATAITANINAYTNPETLPGAGTDPYPGIRTAALSTAAAVSALARTPHGFLTDVQIDIETAGGATVTADGDLSGQYVEITTGACANRFYKIAYVDANAAATVDHVYVYGDLVDECGATPSIRITPGWKYGDKIALVRPAYIHGGNVARLDWKGGKVVANWASITNLFPGLPSGNFYYCNFCVYRSSSSVAPDFANSSWTNVNLGFLGMRTTGEATGALALDNLNAGFSDYHYATAQLDATDAVFDRWYIHDQRLESASGAEGVHGIIATSMTGLNVTRMRVSRLGDDGAIFIPNVFTNTTNEQRIALRQMIVDQCMGLSNSQQAVDVAMISPGANSSQYGITISDGLFHGCIDGGLTLGIFNSTVDRSVQGGTAGVPGVQIGRVTAGYTSVLQSQGVITNYIKNSLFTLLGPTSSTIYTVLGGNVYGSLLFGNLFSSGHELYNTASIERSFIDLGNDSGLSSFLGASPVTTPAVRVDTLPITDSVLMISHTGTKNLCGTSFENNGTITDFDLDHVTFASNVTVNGLVDATCISVSDDTHTLTADGLSISTITPGAGGLGRGFTGGGTLEGARVTNACVETTATPTGATSFGPARTATSVITDELSPDSDDDVPMSAFLAVEGNASICSGTSRPRVLGLSKFGVAHALLGDGINGNVGLITTDESLIRALSGTGSATLRSKTRH